ncbi:MAG: hypothetical protein OER97_04140 [Gammaproteobacteria bacterium]|nr:hypothetical protein [Gammaproteobacteria bacterium]
MSQFGLRALPLWAALLPFITFNVCYLVAVSLEHVSACIPYLAGCTSISSTGRIAPESLIFKAGALPSAVIFVLFWFRCSTFLQLGGQAGSRAIALRVIAILVGLSLVLHAVTLGLSDEPYPALRRKAIDGFALSSLAAQVLFVIAYRPMRVDDTRRLFRWLVAFSVALPALGFAAEVAKWVGAPRHAANNIVAWNASAFMCAYYIVVGRVWQRHGFCSQFSITSGGRAASPSE